MRKGEGGLKGGEALGGSLMGGCCPWSVMLNCSEPRAASGRLPSHRVEVVHCSEPRAS